MNHDCERCGGLCCKTLIVTGMPPEVAAFLAETRGTAIPGGVMIASRCRHLAADGACSRYADRPQECRLYERNGDACKLTRAYGPLALKGAL